MKLIRIDGQQFSDHRPTFNFFDALGQTPYHGDVLWSLSVGSSLQWDQILLSWPLAMLTLLCVACTPLIQNELFEYLTYRA